MENFELFGNTRAKVIRPAIGFMHFGLMVHFIHPDSRKFLSRVLKKLEPWIKNEQNNCRTRPFESRPTVSKKTVSSITKKIKAEGRAIIPI